MKYGTFLIFSIWTFRIFALPAGFVYLHDIDPTIQQDIRYATPYNFIGKPINGYQAQTCILTLPTALALAKAQQALSKLNLSLKVYDCYRPESAVNEFIQWGEQLHQQQMKVMFYPRVNKVDLFRLGYISSKSGHSRGSTVDLTLAPLTANNNSQEHQKLMSCIAPYNQRFNDGSIDMGTNFDCMDALSHEDAAVNKMAQRDRLLLLKIMQKYGFRPYQEEWWHFTLKNEPYPYTYFNFPVIN